MLSSLGELGNRVKKGEKICDMNSSEVYCSEPQECIENVQTKDNTDYGNNRVW